MEIMLLKYDSKTNRNKDIANKIKEEAEELVQALDRGNKEQIFDEALDLITVCLNAINQQIVLHDDLDSAIYGHQNKLKARGWEANKIINFHIEKVV